MFRSKKVSGVAVAGMWLLLLSACSLGGEPPQPTPTAVDINAIYTQVAQTVVAEQNSIVTMTAVAQLTQAALASPTPEVTLTPTISLATQVGFPTITALATNPLVVQPAASGCDNLAWVADNTHPDGELLGEDREIFKEWEVKNTGTCNWTGDYKLSWAGGDAIGGAYSVKLAQIVKPGQTIAIGITLRTPKKKVKVLSGLWRMQNAAGEFFGDWLSCTISVK
jgi:hypothetical protein